MQFSTTSKKPTISSCCWLPKKYFVRMSKIVYFVVRVWWLWCKTCCIFEKQRRHYIGFSLWMEFQNKNKTEV